MDSEVTASSSVSTSAPTPQPVKVASNQAATPPIPAAANAASSSSAAQPIQAIAPDGQVAPQALTTPAVADDNDLIEREWVIKAKEIVAETRQDPYRQNRQLAAIKADYLRKRYNKIIKLSE